MSAEEIFKLIAHGQDNAMCPHRFVTIAVPGFHDVFKHPNVRFST